MLGWSIRARACRSASNRASTWRLSMPALMILSATMRRTGCGLLGHVDRAHAPFADRLQQLVGADDRAGQLGRRGAEVTDERRGGSGRRFEEAAGVVVDLQQGLDPLPQRPNRRRTPPAGTPGACRVVLIQCGDKRSRSVIARCLHVMSSERQCVFRRPDAQRTFANAKTTFWIVPGRS